MMHKAYQNEWPHFVIFGIFNVSKQMGHKGVLFSEWVDKINMTLVHGIAWSGSVRILSILEIFVIAEGYKTKRKLYAKDKDHK